MQRTRFSILVQSLNESRAWFAVVFNHFYLEFKLVSYFNVSNAYLTKKMRWILIYFLTIYTRNTAIIFKFCDMSIKVIKKSYLSWILKFIFYRIIFLPMITESFLKNVKQNAHLKYAFKDKNAHFWHNTS